MQFYLYSSQDLIIKSSSIITLNAGNVYCLKCEDREIIEIYCTKSAGVIMLNSTTLINKQHSQINFHQLNENNILCEIKLFVLNENIRNYVIKHANLKLIENIDTTYIYLNSKYYGCVKEESKNVIFETREKDGKQYGIVQFGQQKKYIIIFNTTEVVYFNQVIDSEITKDYAQMYTHIPNMFNVGVLTKCEFANGCLTNKTVCDRGDERKQNNPEFNIIYFLEAIKCKRFKYAYSKLSYELRAFLNIETLSEYFNDFEQYIYIQQQDVYITLKNNKVIGVYHFVVKDNLIDNIY